MEYYTAANFLFERRQFRPKPGTESTRDLLAHLGDPHEELTAIQIAGSNGKGSTARMTESMFRSAGQSVGLYTSPHFDDIRERIVVDGRMIPKTAICHFVDAVHEYVTERTAAGDPVTFFEITTALALWYFAEEDVDIAVLEVGIGGQFDATSVIEPVASAVTSVSLEHTELLGDTIEEIARDKTHVAPRDRPLVTGATGDALEAIRKRCQELHEERNTGIAPEEQVITVGDASADVRTEYHGRVNHQEAEIEIAGPEVGFKTRIPLLGAHQATNAGIAVTLVHQLLPGMDAIDPSGLRGAFWPGRFEVMAEEPLIVLDGAHNPGACETLTNVLDEFSFDQLHLVIGAMHDKDYQAMADALPTPDTVIATRPVPDRAADPAALANVFEQRGVQSVKTVPSVPGGIDAAIDVADPGDCVLVTGSLYTVSEARERWVRPTIPKRITRPDEAHVALRAADIPSHDQADVAGSAVHRVLKTRVQPRVARWLEEELRARGGDATRSGLDGQIEENRDTLLMGSQREFDALFEVMRTTSDGLAALADDLEDAVHDSAPTGPYPWADEPVIMGILNVTPDSFHDGGAYTTIEDAVARADAMIAEGAKIIDIGGESTRPGAESVPPETERERVLPVIEALSSRDVMLSIDTRRAGVADAAIAAGADMINDVSGLGDPEMRFVAAERDVPIVVMHSIHTPVIPDRKVTYDDVVEDVIAELRERVLLAEKAGLDRSQIIVDPGIGFGKRAAESFTLLGRCGELSALGCPLMIGHSNKSMFDLIDQPAGARDAATTAGTAIGVAAGADIVRVHDVAPNLAALRAVRAAGVR